MRGEMAKEPHFYTAGEWINKDSPQIGPWPLSKKKAGDRSRIKSGQTQRIQAMLRRLEKEGIK